ncbi:MAG TPA: hypothetical protein VGP93_18585, partial [Polyangiaceae bacterium]|nr:hypothetical protein [Polyangiaceae bacterium]
EFVTKIGTGGIKYPANCSAANDGKRYFLDGYLHIAKDMSLDHGQTQIELFRANDSEGAGAGESFQVRVSLGNWLSKGDIDDLWDSAKNVKTSAYHSKKGEVTEDALHVHLADGKVAGPKDNVRVTVSLQLLPHINPSDPTNCEYVFESATKL